MIKTKAKLKKTGETYTVEIRRTAKIAPGSISIHVKDADGKHQTIRYEEDGRPSSLNRDGSPNYIRIETLYLLNKHWEVTWVDTEGFSQLDKETKERHLHIYEGFLPIIREQKIKELGI